MQSSDVFWLSVCQEEKSADHRQRLLTRDGKVNYREPPLTWTKANRPRIPGRGVIGDCDADRTRLTCLSPAVRKSDVVCASFARRVMRYVQGSSGVFLDKVNF